MTNVFVAPKIKVEEEKALQETPRVVTYKPL